jgi:FlaA1/EpsC-like NDP-sugar epimerase
VTLSSSAKRIRHAGGRVPVPPELSGAEAVDPAGAVDFALRHRAPIKFLLHIAIFTAAWILAWLARFDLDLPRDRWSAAVRLLPLLLLVKSAAFLSLGLFRGWWRYVSIQDIRPIAAGCGLGTLLLVGAGTLLPGFESVPRSVYLLDWGASLILVLLPRYIIRVGRQAYSRWGEGRGRRVLIVGAGAAGQMIAREMRGNPALRMSPVGFVDDDPAKIGARIQGLRVLGAHEEIGEICRRHRAGEVVIAIPSAPAAVLRHLVAHCREVSVKFSLLPGVGEMIDGGPGVRSLRHMNIEDLLGREPVTLDTDILRRDITGQVVMVTGAAGSIGSELCRQVAALSPSRLVLFEIAESALFELELELKDLFPGVPLAPVIGDIRDRRRVEEVVSAWRPSVVYHAAAYKHVPVMEMHPVEAVKNNVFGTRVLAECAARHGVRRFVLVSTDKAVRPANVMGATKRVAELIVQNMNGKGRNTTFVAVRFGNVLDSVGSVVRIFRRQLETTGRLTVTHPEASRYFMLIPEAAGLILQAGAMGKGGEVFVLDMGEPVNIKDLARNMVRLSGRELGVNAEIVFTGLRPGEKLHEELVVEGEDVTRTPHPKVMILMGSGRMPREWSARLDLLMERVSLNDRPGVVRLLDDLVDGYMSDYACQVAPGDAADLEDLAGLDVLEAPKTLH